MTKATGQAKDVRMDPSACRPEQPERQAAPQTQPRAPRSSDAQSHGPEHLGLLANAASHDQSNRNGRRHLSSSQGLLEAAIPRPTAQSSWDTSRPPRAMTRATGQAEDVRTSPGACRPEQPERQVATQQHARAPRSSDSQRHCPEQPGQLATAATHDQSDGSG